MGGMKGGTGTGGAVGNDIGNAGITRFWNSGNYGQISWLLIFAFVSIVALFRKPSKKNRDTSYASFIYWVLWLATIFFFFSFAGFWHRYYLCMAAPAIAALAGPGIVAMAKDFHEKKGWRQFLLPAAFILNLIVEIIYVAGYASIRTWLIPLMLAAAAVAIVFMALNYIKPAKLKMLAATGFMLLAMLAPSFYWALTVVMYVPQNVTMPYAGPELASTETVRGMTSNQETLTTGDSGTLALEKYLVAHYKSGTYLVVSQRANDVAQFIVDTGLPAVAYGGFLGSDNSLTLAQFKQLVKEGKITYVLISSQNGTNSEIVSYVKSNATLIDSSEYGVTSTSTSTSTTSGSATSQTNSANQSNSTASEGASSSNNGVSGSSLYLFK
jgi:4-amino-4-deoxy-L-arabinose transferase-like glycosyltransferase